MYDNFLAKEIGKGFWPIADARQPVRKGKNWPKESECLASLKGTISGFEKHLQC